MGAHLQDPSVPAPGVEIPANLLTGESNRLVELQREEQGKKIGQGVAPDPGLGGALGATVFVLALLAGAFLVLRRFLGRSRFLPGAAPVKILGRKALGPRQELILVDVGTRVLLVGASRETLERLGEVTSAEELAALRSRCGAAPAEPLPVRAPADPTPPADRRPAAGYDGVIEELSRVRASVRDWARQEVAP